MVLLETDFIFPSALCIIAGIVCVIISIIQFQKYANEIRSFKENAYKINAEIVGYDSSLDSDGHSCYSSVYNYNHPNLGCIKLRSKVYKPRKPKLGKVKTIYYNPKYPYAYYNNIMDLYYPIVLLLTIGLMFIGGGIIFLFS